MENPTLPRKAMLGHKVRRLRGELGLTQARMAERLGISASYLTLIEQNQRPLTVPVLLRLAQSFAIDLQTFAGNDEAHLVSALREVFADPLFQRRTPREADLREVARVSGPLCEAVLQLYAAYRKTTDDFRALAERVADQEKLQILPTNALPVEQVREFLQDHGNYFPDLEEEAQTIAGEVNAQPGDLQRSLTDYLSRAHGVRARIVPADLLGPLVRRYDPHKRALLLSEVLAPHKRSFQLGVQIAYLRCHDLLDELTADPRLAHPEARWMARLALANYLAGAIAMPYGRFIAAARGLRYDLDLLKLRFDSSFEQVCHRLTTLQKPGDKGIPFFLIRVDRAGNVSKRFLGGAFFFARYGGACPRYVVYDAFRVPGAIQTQVSQMTDGAAYFSVARTVSAVEGGYGQPTQQFALALGCDIAFASQMVYADGIDFGNAAQRVPVGVNCRVCERIDCAQRAFPPLNHRLATDDHSRGVSPYSFNRQ